MKRNPQRAIRKTSTKFTKPQASIVDPELISGSLQLNRAERRKLISELRGWIKTLESPLDPSLQKIAGHFGPEDRYQFALMLQRRAQRLFVLRPRPDDPELQNCAHLEDRERYRVAMDLDRWAQQLFMSCPSERLLRAPVGSWRN